MSERVKMPALGESVTEGTVTRWLKNVGDSVEVDEPLLEVSTDKVDTEIPSPVAGTLQEVLVQEDDTVPVGADLAVIGDGAPRPRVATTSRRPRSRPPRPSRPPRRTRATGPTTPSPTRPTAGRSPRPATRAARSRPSRRPTRRTPRRRRRRRRPRPRPVATRGATPVVAARP